MSSVKEILVLHHSHLDVGYTHSQPTLWELQRDYIDEAIDLCEQTADWPEACRFRWTCEATAPVIKWLKSASDKQLVRLERLLKNQQIGISALNVHSTPLCSDEQLIRMIGPVKELRSRFGIKLNTAINHDINGQPWPLTQILLDSGIELYITGINIHFGGIPGVRPRAFYWQAPDGRQLLTFHGEHYSMFTQICKTWENDTDIMAQGLQTYLRRLEREEYPYDFIYLTATNIPMLDNTPPDCDLAQLVRRWNSENREQTIRFVTPELLFERLKAIPRDSIPVRPGDWTDYWNFGSASSAVETRLNRKTKQSMRSYELLESVGHATTARFRKIKDEAWENLDLFEEHTWGASASVTQPDSLHVRTQWIHKANYVHTANSLTTYLLGRQLDGFAGNAPQSDGIEGVLLLNPTSVHQQYDLRIPADFMRAGRHLAADRLRFNARNENGYADAPSFGVIEIPPFSVRKIPFVNTKQANASDQLKISEDCIITPYYRLSFNPQTGRIIELYDKTADWQVIDATSDWTLFQFVRETVDPLLAVEHRSTLFNRDVEKCNNSVSCWNHEWPARRETACRLLSCSVTRQPNQATLTLCWEAPGVRDLRQQITLFAYRPGIRMVASFTKEDIREPESIYFVFPLNVDAGWQACYDTAGMYVNLESEQLSGTCRDWVTVDETVSVFNQTHGVTLACPDAPVVQIGGFNFGKEQQSIPRDARPLLVAWPITNYWDTNFRASQPGSVTVTYELSTFEKFDAVRTYEAGIAAADPVEMWPLVVCPDEGLSRFITIEGEGIRASYVKLAEDGQSSVIRLRNLLRKITTATVKVHGARLLSCSLVNPLEEDLGLLSIESDAVTLELSALEFINVRLTVQPD